MEPSLNNFEDKIDISSLGANLSEALKLYFDDLCLRQSNEYTWTLSVAVNFEGNSLGFGVEGNLAINLPVILSPEREISKSFADELFKAIQIWENTVAPNLKNGAYSFSLKQNSYNAIKKLVVMNCMDLIYRCS